MWQVTGDRWHVIHKAVCRTAPAAPVLLNIPLHDISVNSLHEIWIYPPRTSSTRLLDIHWFRGRSAYTCSLQRYTALYYTTLHNTALHCTMLHYTALHFTALHYTTLHYTALHYTTLHYTTLHYTTLHYTTLHYTTLYYTTLICTTLHYAATCYTTLHCTTLHYTELNCITLHCTALNSTTLHNRVYKNIKSDDDISNYNYLVSFVPEF